MKNSSIKIHLIYGAIGGLMLILFHFVRYLIDPMWVLGEHMFTILAIFLAVLFLMSMLAMRAWKRQTGGEVQYGTALKYVFVCMFMASAVSGLYETGFDYSIGMDIALENEDRVKAMIKRRSDEAYLLGYQMGAEASEEEMARKREELALEDIPQKDMEERWQRYLYSREVNVSKIIKSILNYLLIVLPLSMLVALFVRSRKPRSGAYPEVPAPVQ